MTESLFQVQPNAHCYWPVVSAVFKDGAPTRLRAFSSNGDGDEEADLGGTAGVPEGPGPAVVGDAMLKNHQS